MIKQQMFIGAALIAGVAAGYFMRGESAASPRVSAADSTTKVERRGKIADAGDAASNAALRKRVAELERLLAERAVIGKGAETAAEQVAEIKPQEDIRNRWRPPSFEELKKNDPERYAQMTNGMARFRQRQLRRAQGKLDFLSSVDTSKMSDSAKNTHQKLQELLARREEMRQGGMEKFESLSDEERQAHFEEMRTLDRELRATSAAERRNLLSETAKNLGLSGDDVSAFSSTIEQVIQATDNYGMHGGGMPPPPSGNPPPNMR